MQILAKLLAAYCLNEASLEGHLTFINNLSVRAMTFRDEAARRSFDEDVKKRTKEFWLTLKSKISKSDIPAVEAALQKVDNFWEQKFIGELPIKCKASPYRIIEQAKSGYKVSTEP